MCFGRTVTIQSPPFYCARILLSKILTGQEFGSQILVPDILPKLNTINLSPVFFFIQGRSELGQAQTNLIKVVIYKFYGEILTKCNIRIRLLQIAMSTSMGTY